MNERSTPVLYSVFISIEITPEVEAMPKRELDLELLQLHKEILDGNYEYEDNVTFPYIVRIGKDTVRRCSVHNRIVQKIAVSSKITQMPLWKQSGILL